MRKLPDIYSTNQQYKQQEIMRLSYTNTVDVEEAMKVVAEWVGKSGIKVIYHNGTAIDADIRGKRIRIPRVGELSMDTLMDLRHNIYHEAGHIAETDIDKPAGMLGDILNALEDVRMEAKLAEEHKGCKAVFKHGSVKANKNNGKRITELQMANKQFPQVPEALFAMMFKAVGLRPAWSLAETADRYVEAAWDTFSKIKNCKNTSDALVLAEEVLKILAQTKQKMDEEKKQEKEEQKEQEQQQEDSESEESEDGENEKGEDGEEQEGEDGEEQEGEGQEEEENDSPEPAPMNDFPEDEEDESKSEAGDSEESEDEEEDEEDSADSDKGHDETELDGVDQDGESEEGNSETSGEDDSKKEEQEEEDDGPNPEDLDDMTAEELEELLKEDAGTEEFDRNKIMNEELQEELKNSDATDGYTPLVDNDIHTTVEVTPELKKEYIEKRKKVASEIMGMSRSLEQALLTMAMETKQSMLETGKIDSRRYVQIAKSLSKQVMYQVEEGTELDTVIGIIIDESGSMNSTYLEIQLLAIALGETLKALGIPFEIVGTTTKYMQGMDVPALNGFSRTNPIIFKHYKDFNEEWDQVKSRITQTGDYNHNIDNETVDYMKRRLQNRPERRKVIFSLSDGCPMSGHNNDYEQREELVKVCEKSRKEGVEVYGFGIGTRSPEQFYGTENFIHLEDGRMGQKFFRELGDIITKGGQA